MITRVITIPIEITPAEAAFEFCNWGDEQQAAFFNEIAEQTTQWDKPFCFQLQYITDCESLTDGGRHVMESIGDYGVAQSEIDEENEK